MVGVAVRDSHSLSFRVMLDVPLDPMPEWSKMCCMPLCVLAADQ